METKKEKSRSTVISLTNFKKSANALAGHYNILNNNTFVLLKKKAEAGAITVNKKQYMIATVFKDLMQDIFKLTENAEKKAKHN